MIRIVIVSLFFANATLHANPSIQTGTKNVTVVSSIWEGFAEPGGTGIYFELLKAVYLDSKFELTFQPSEFSRALNHFNFGKADIMVGVLKHEAPKAHFPKWILDTDLPIVGFTNKSAVIDLAQLERYNVGWMGMYGMDKFFPDLTKAYRFERREAAFSMLVANRLDVFLDYAHNEHEAYKDTLVFKVIRPSEPMYLVFQNDIKGKILADIYDKRMAQLRKSGELARIFGEQYRRSGLIEFKVSP